MAVTRAQLRAHIGKALGRNYYISSTTTSASGNAKEVVDAARTEHDEFWNGATIRISGEDRPLRGGAGVNTNRSPTLFLDRALTSIPGSGVAYEVLKTFTFTDVDEAIDTTLEDMYPYFFDPVNDTSTILATNTNEYALNAAWRQIVTVEREVFSTVPTKYSYLASGIDDRLLEDPTSFRLLLSEVPTGSLVGLRLRIFARAIPTLGSTDASITVHPFSVIVPGALAYLYRKGANADMGSISEPWRRKALEQQAIYEERRRRLAPSRSPVDTRLPYVIVG